GTYFVSGSGSDIWGTADQFNFASAPLSGNGILVARVTLLQNTDPWAKAGIMFRETQGNSSRDVYLVMTPHNQVQFDDRPTAGGAAIDSGDATGVAFPVWLKLVRNANQFTAFWSSNGSAWNPVGGAVTVNMNAN